jgi:hypothetical protein
MNKYDSVLEIYAESGLRTIEDWIRHGRDLEIGAKPRANTRQRGVLVRLYTRDQTHSQGRSRSKMNTMRRARVPGEFGRRAKGALKGQVVTPRTFR